VSIISTSAQMGLRMGPVGLALPRRQLGLVRLCLLLLCRSALAGAWGRKQGDVSPLLDASSSKDVWCDGVHGFPGRRMQRCCTLFLDTPSMQLGISWGAASVDTIEEWQRRKCDKFGPMLLAARRLQGGEGSTRVVGEQGGWRSPRVWLAGGR
jgi:hypothetical protein